MRNPSQQTKGRGDGGYNNNNIRETKRNNSVSRSRYSRFRKSVLFLFEAVLYGSSLLYSCIRHRY
ncbi:hypothetical protein K504DRAFT_530884 [Pleomassaria siparia CBS 279.74]|uniref:Uncharacterized protein n=1 Tax=Pleomassaria siparia CBS 279.74 TaxID=1314801 RepID=A0A6G1KMH0_9PLEO|nr:hypothetical protein K504DRAFT_530884 [Pleomassaria siparia CBS 279.74]